MTRLLAKASALMLLVVLGAATAQAGPMYVFMVVDPATTAGAGVTTVAPGMNVTSTRSGPGTWHLYAVDDVDGSFGIRNYSVTLAGTTAVNHRSPNTGYTDANTDPFNAGFNDLRTATNINPIAAGQGLTNNPQIGGFGQAASNFPAKVADASGGYSGTTSGQWGTYGDGVYLVPLASSGIVQASGHTRSALFLAEGTGTAPSVLSASIAVYTNEGLTTSTFGQPIALNQNPFIPEPATISLVGLALLGGLGYVRRRR